MSDLAVSFMTLVSDYNSWTANDVMNHIERLIKPKVSIDRVFSVIDEEIDIEVNNDAHSSATISFLFNFFGDLLNKGI
ncbi:hypothetical protein [Metaclostridioides mangenotii]|uniref:hypothetical protein n=1 Tax=Metaclostridioides mangenotii TaxID=1540 RepID=UPI0026ED7C71|nr:hypothetical protein [Clostridioides mangenotii]